MIDPTRLSALLSGAALLALSSAACARPGDAPLPPHAPEAIAPSSTPTVPGMAQQGTTQAGMTLRQALSLAYRSNPTLLGEQANQRAVAENSDQARAGWRPKITANIDANYQQGPYSGAYGLGTFQTNYAEGYLDYQQHLYTFGHTANMARAADLRSRAEIQNLRLAEATTFTNVVTAFMDVLRDQYVLDVRKADLATLTRQASLTLSRFNLGGGPTEQMTRSDVAQAETRRQSAVVALANAQAQLAASRAIFRATVGIEAPPLVQPEVLPQMPDSLPQALEFAEISNPQLAANRATRAATEADIDTARSQWGPQIVMDAQLGGIGPAQPFRTRNYSQETYGLIRLTQPIYNGDLYNSQIRQARDKDSQAQQNVELARRAAVQAVVTNWRAVEAGLVAVRAGAAEVQAGQTALRGYQLEYGYGTRTTTDVLYADQTLRSAQVELATSQHDLIVAEAGLLAAMGRLQANYMLPGERPYDAEGEAIRARRRGWFPLQVPAQVLDNAGWSSPPKP